MGVGEPRAYHRLRRSARNAGVPITQAHKGETPTPCIPSARAFSAILRPIVSALTAPQPWLQVIDLALLAVLFDQWREVQRRRAARWVAALRSPLGQRAEARPERSTSVPTGIHLYVLVRASLHFPFFQYMYVPQLPAGLAFV